MRDREEGRAQRKGKLRLLVTGFCDVLKDRQSWFQSQFQRLCEIWFLSWGGQQLVWGFPWVGGVMTGVLCSKLRETQSPQWSLWRN